MKKHFLFSLAFLFMISSGFSQTVNLKVTYAFKGIEVGYDHPSQTEVFIDGFSEGISDVSIQSKGGSFNVPVLKGDHDILVMNYAQYEGVWEEHTIDNNYSIDAFLETSYDFKKNSKLYLVFDLDNAMQYSWKKPVKNKK